MLILTYVIVTRNGDIMSIDFAILGILSYKSMTGYDIKKVIQGSTSLETTIWNFIREIFAEHMKMS
jgi:DNA-binding PadR family transcriptional regulator